ncbi:2-hydroxyacid dehydrogenase [Paroceanicella profunda]|uniref:2-hydroxyacid dehydrogenase n=1 Tax=Paroceanicella profunda TaxID=2579971 RepID=A0A5B8FY40_9RHOB|nr:2-hydroxyacid dehydrogenase [Paroceanicella profunda]QDL93415.1 2-hydroxyacid dehydrogenase [Paroceanicella profunda]
MKPEILMMGPMHPVCMTALEDAYTIHRYWEADNKTAFLAENGPGIRAVATNGHLGCPEAIITALPKLEIISSYGVGYDAIPVKFAIEHGARITNTPNVLNDAVAEMALGLMLALCRRIPQADAFMREGKWAKGGYPLTGELTDRKVGILGLGRIGKEIAKRCEAFKMTVVYHGRRAQEGVEWQYYGDLEEMARDVDWLVVIAPGSAETKGIVSRKVLEALGPDGAIVNVARGALIDEAAMAELLASGGLGGAALDVFEEEPLPDVTPFLLDNVVLSPHQGSATYKTRAAMGQLVVDNLAAHFAGKPLISEVTE